MKSINRRNVILRQLWNADLLQIIKKNNIFDVTILIMFLLVISSPLILVNNNNISKVENRTLAQFPKLKLSSGINNKFSKEFDSWFNDQYGFRDYLIKYSSLLHVKIFSTSPSNRVLLGKDGWLFYADKADGDSVSCYQNINLYTEEKLKIIKDNLVEQENWCKMHDAEFILMFIPNKETIYGEYYPNGINKMGSYSKLDQVINYLKLHTDIRIVDVRKELINAKNRAQIYYKTDTHWNSFGAFIGYQGLIKEINKSNPKVKPDTLDDFDIQKVNQKGGDLTRILNLEYYYDDSDFIFKRKKDDTYIINIPLNDFDGGRDISKSSDKLLPKAIMFRDSFTKKMIPFISNQFSEIVYDWTEKINHNLIKEEKPNIVIFEIVERRIDFLINKNPLD